MTRTPDEIKKAMLHCSPVSCRSNDCPYRDDTPKYEGDMPVCRMKLWHDMGCLIQQLQAENAEKDARIQQLEKDKADLLEERELNDFLRDRVKQLEADKNRTMENAEILSASVRRLEAERDAAVKSLRGRCFECKHNKTSVCLICSKDKGLKYWQWRGVTKEESDDGKE